MLLTQQQLHVMGKICCEFFILQQMHQLTERAQLLCQCLAFQTSKTGDTNVHFIRPVAPTPRSEI